MQTWKSVSIGRGTIVILAYVCILSQLGQQNLNGIGKQISYQPVIRCHLTETEVSSTCQWTNKNKRVVQLNRAACVDLEYQNHAGL